MDRLLQCATHALPYFSASVRKQTEYLVDATLHFRFPRLRLPSTWSARSCHTTTSSLKYPGLTPSNICLINIKYNRNFSRTALCKLTAEMCLHLGKLNNPGEAAKNVFDRLIDYMPLVSHHSVFVDNVKWYINCCSSHQSARMGLWHRLRVLSSQKWRLWCLLSIESADRLQHSWLKTRKGSKISSSVFSIWHAV